MSDFFIKKRRREPLELQLTAMIDIFSLIVIFLIMGTVMGGVEITPPKEISIPKSFSKESLESAPQVLFLDNEISFALLDLKIPYSDFESSSSSVKLQEAKKEIGAYLQNLPTVAKSSGILLNVVADAETPYNKIFHVVKFFRECGFESVLFVTAGMEESSNDI